MSIIKKPVAVFARAQLSSVAGGMTDYFVMLLFTEGAGIHYTVSILLSGSIGAIVNFSINRYWTFRSHDAAALPAGPQLIRFGLMVCGSILLKSAGTFLLTQYFLTDYRINRLIVDLCVSLGFNYTLQSYWVFKKRSY